MDLTLVRLAHVVREGSAEHERLRTELQAIQAVAEAAAERFRPGNPPPSCRFSGRVMSAFAASADAVLLALDALAADRIDHALSVKEQEFRTARSARWVLEIEAVAASQSAVQGGTLAVSFQ